jgi:hypothetical protein
MVPAYAPTSIAPQGSCRSGHVDLAAKRAKAIHSVSADAKTYSEN